jgi:hypothetical protein
MISVCITIHLISRAQVQMITREILFTKGKIERG